MGETATKYAFGTVPADEYIHIEPPASQGDLGWALSLSDALGQMLAEKADLEGELAELQFQVSDMEAEAALQENVQAGKNAESREAMKLKCLLGWPAYLSASLRQRELKAQVARLWGRIEVERERLHTAQAWLRSQGQQ